MWRHHQARGQNVVQVRGDLCCGRRGVLSAIEPGCQVEIKVLAKREGAQGVVASVVVQVFGSLLPSHLNDQQARSRPQNFLSITPPLVVPYIWFLVVNNESRGEQ